MASVAAKKLVEFWGSTREIPKNRSKFTKNYIFDIFWFPVHKRFRAFQLLDGFWWEYWDVSKIVSLVKIVLPMGQSQFFFKSGKFCRSPKAWVALPIAPNYRIVILILVQIPSLKNSWFVKIERKMSKLQGIIWLTFFLIKMPNLASFYFFTLDHFGRS